MPLIASDSMELSGSLWWLFIIDTILIAAAGYVINDIFDVKADYLNKPKNTFIGNDKIPIHIAWFFYGALVLDGFIIATYIAFAINKPHLLIIYPIATVLLFLYSYKFKKLLLLGNLVVAIFCAFVPGIILYAEWDVINQKDLLSSFEYEFVINMFVAYISFAFLSTIVREIIKDIEDIIGDTKSGYKTLPIIVGEKNAKYTAIFFGILLILSYAFWVLPFITIDFIVVIIPLTIIMLLYSLYIIKNIIDASQKEDYTNISTQLKILMVISLFIFLCIPFLNQSIF